MRVISRIKLANLRASLRQLGAKPEQANLKNPGRFGDGSVGGRRHATGPLPRCAGASTCFLPWPLWRLVCLRVFITCVLCSSSNVAVHRPQIQPQAGSGQRLWQHTRHCTPSWGSVLELGSGWPPFVPALAGCLHSRNGLHSRPSPTAFDQRTHLSALAWRRVGCGRRSAGSRQRRSTPSA